MKRKSEGGNKQPFQRKKTELVFDPQKRVEFLTGFHKRKQHRKKIAQGEMQRKLKEETKRIRAEAKEKMRNLYHSYKPIPELTEEDKAEEQEDEYDTENVTVKVVELSTRDLAKENNWIGENRGMVKDDESDAENSSDDGNDEQQLGVVPGMELEGEKKVKRKHKLSAEEGSSNEAENGESAVKEKAKPKKGPVLNLDGIRSKKDLNHKIKRYALKSMKTSQAFRQKTRLQQQKQLKQSRRIRHQKEKHLKQKKGFNKHRNGNDRGETKRKRKDD
ncbi:nucleolar protein 12 [Anopheles arabiensis]|uniref:Nucleolar protein 12 n=2 Tax=gambiae species complex TaxID=44542 RepID=Q5TSY4_ANOGA|nr:nucleolar protein 12 [Anopheles arabiensis]EAL40543.3 AGAP004463-PA [Anopheles gambiae str. PEST]